MKQEEFNGTSGPTSKSGSSQLVSELQQYFAIYANDLKKVREGKGAVELLHDEQTFDIVVKLLGVLDKVKKLDAVDGEVDTKNKPEATVRNLQDIVLGEKSKK